MAQGVPNGSQVCPSAMAVMDVEEAAFEDVAVPHGPLRQAPVMKLAVAVAEAQGPLRQAPVRKDAVEEGAHGPLRQAPVRVIPCACLLLVEER